MVRRINCIDAITGEVPDESITRTKLTDGSLEDGISICPGEGLSDEATILAATVQSH